MVSFKICTDTHLVTDRCLSLLLDDSWMDTIEHRQRRDSIRATWASRATFGNHIRVLFMLGSTHDLSLMQQVRLEFDTYRDIVQQTFIDTYRNLTYKGITHSFIHSPHVTRLEEMCHVVCRHHGTALDITPLPASAIRTQNRR
jgi:hypothetical protein